MKMCIELAKKGKGEVSPNPLVGCVVLDENDEVISTGFHKKCGENHAERDALLKLPKDAGKTLIVNLEPCSHFGKTPPCTDLIIEKGIKKVVIGMRDVNPKVSGIEKLKQANIEITENVLHDECVRLNEIFIKNMTKRKPFIAIKTATTLDGKTATSTGSSKWITSEKARCEVKNIRKAYDAIMTTSLTILKDNPTMEHKRKIILDRELKTDFSSKIYQSGEIYVFFDKDLSMPAYKNIKFIPTPVKNGLLDLEYITEMSYESGINSILVEAGGRLSGEILNYADKVYHFIAPKITGDNTSLSCFDFRKITDISEAKEFKISEIQNFEPDIMLIYYPVIL